MPKVNLILAKNESKSVNVKWVVSVALDADDRITNRDKLCDPLVSPCLFPIPHFVHDVLAIVIYKTKAL